jgi:hypothetical protein
MTIPATPAAVCATCNGTTLIEYDDAFGEPRNAPCPDCRKPGEARLIPIPEHMRNFSINDDGLLDEDTHFVLASRYHADVASRLSELQRLRDALAEVLRISLGKPFDAADACAVIERVARTALGGRL